MSNQSSDAENTVQGTPTTEAVDSPDTNESTDAGKFDQAAVDAIVGRQLAKQASKFEKQIAELKAQVAPKQETPPANETAATPELEAVRAELRAFQEKVQRQEADSAIKEAALQAGVPVAKLNYVTRFADRDGVLVDGAVDSAAAIESVKALIADFPELTGTPAPQGTNKPFGAGPGSSPAGKGKPKTIEEALARKMGL